MAPVVEQLPGAPSCLLGEGALWDTASGCLWWVDIRGQMLFCHDPQHGTLGHWAMDEWITRAIPMGSSGDLLVTLASAFGVLERQGTGFVFRSHQLLDEPGMRFNDGALDPDGHFWAGTMRIEEDAQCGKWLRIAADGRSRMQLDTPAFTVTNGPAFDAANSKVYLTDSAARTIYRGDYDTAVGVRDLAPWRRFEAGEGYPDGMVIGPDGLLWISFWDGACLRALDQEGATMHWVPLPVSRPTSIAFRDDATLYVTSARFGLGADGMQGHTLLVKLHG